MASKSSIFVICAVIAATNAEFTVTPRIVGGENATEGQFPYQVSLRTTSDNRHFCGASILTNRFLLTAAHCTQAVQSNPDAMFAVVGTVFLQQNGMIFQIDKITPHDDWDFENIMHDISLLRTQKEIVFSDTIQKIGLPVNDIDEGTPVQFSGWGRVDNNQFGPQPNNLLYAEASTMSIAQCQLFFKWSGMIEEYYVYNTSLCTLPKKKVGACMGDSGGPLVDISHPHDKKFVGISSWGVRPCGAGYPDVYTRVYPYVGWIVRKMVEQIDPST